jgi:hypothetical protein
MLSVASVEINELKDSLRYAEYMLSRTKEEKEELELDMVKNDVDKQQSTKLIKDNEFEKNEAYKQID